MRTLMFDKCWGRVGAAGRCEMDAFYFMGGLPQQSFRGCGSVRLIVSGERIVVADCFEGAD